MDLDALPALLHPVTNRSQSTCNHPSRALQARLLRLVVSPQSRLARRKDESLLPKEGTMKYALLIYNTPEVRELPEEQLKALIGEYEEISRVPGVLGGQQLQ